MGGNQQRFVTFQKEIKLASDPDNLRVIEEVIEGLRDELNFKDDSYGNVMIATTEAVNNGIIHGNHSDPSKQVTISFEATTPYRISVSVEDQGTGFDPDKLSDPTAPENIENPGGRGVFIMKHLSDEISFLNQGRKVVMVFNI